LFSKGFHEGADEDPDMFRPVIVRRADQGVKKKRNLVLAVIVAGHTFP
jgi:hypothetical protein